MSAGVRLVCVLLLCVASHGHAQSKRSGSIEVLLTRAEWLVSKGQAERALPLLRRAMQRAPHDPTPVQRFAALALPDVNDPAVLTPNASTPNALRENAQTILHAIEQVAMRDDSGVGDRAERLRDEQIWALVFAQSLDAAIAVWSARHVRLDREHAELGRKLATLAVKWDDLATAQRVLETCLQANAEDHTLRSDVAAVALARGRVADAVRWFREVAVAQPDNLTAQRDLAGALLADGDALTAMGLLRSIPACASDCDCALELSRAALAAQQPNVAVEASGRALALCERDDPEPALWLAAAEQQAGRVAQAKAAFRLALQRDPHSSRAREGLRALEAAAMSAN